MFNWTLHHLKKGFQFSALWLLYRKVIYNAPSCKNFFVFTFRALPHHFFFSFLFTKEHHCSCSPRCCFSFVWWSTNSVISPFSLEGSSRKVLLSGHPEPTETGFDAPEHKSHAHRSQYEPINPTFCRWWLGYTAEPNSGKLTSNLAAPNSKRQSERPTKRIFHWPDISTIFLVPGHPPTRKQLTLSSNFLVGTPAYLPRSLGTLLYSMRFITSVSIFKDKLSAFDIHF